MFQDRQNSMKSLRAEGTLTFRSRLMVVAVIALSAFLLFGYLYKAQIGRHVKTVKSRFLKSRGGRQSLMEQHLAMWPTPTDVTVVTAYINIGSFQKGEGDTTFDPETYHKWMEIFHQITNPVIAYFDSDQDIAMFKVFRNMLPPNRTKIVKVSRNKTWAFSLRPAIAKIFSQAYYPKHHPNTVIPDYSCVMHAKYEFMSSAVKENPFNTRYFAWLDIGLFRAKVNQPSAPFSIELPPQFDARSVAYTQVEPLGPTPRTAKQIVQGNLVWVCGCFFIGRSDVMKLWTKQYMRFTERMLSTGWTSTDQQVLYYMFQPQNNRSSLIDVRIQTYTGDGRFDAWFHLGYLSAKPWKRKT